MEMKEGKVRVKSQLLLLLLLCGTLLVVAACGSTQGGEGGTDDEVVLRLVNSWPETSFQGEPSQIFMERVEEDSNESITFEYVGGPDAIPNDQQAEAVQSGVVDIAHLAAPYYASQSPIAGALSYSELTPEVERERGAIDALNESVEQQLNARILGRTLPIQYALLVDGQVDGLADLQDITFRSSATYVPLLEAVGAGYEIMGEGDAYQALERGIISGAAWPEYGFTNFGLQEQLQCKVQPSFWRAANHHLINADTWNQLSPEQQEIVTQVSAELLDVVENTTLEEFAAEERQLMQEEDMGICQLPDADAEDFLQLASDSGWERLRAEVRSEDREYLEEEIEPLFRE